MLSEEELAGVPLLVFCNKQDVEDALKPEEISEELGLAGGEKGRDWSVRGSCAVKGEGIEEGLDWCVMNDMQAPFTKNGLPGLSMPYKRNRTTLVVPFRAPVISSIRSAVETDNVTIVFIHHSSHCIELRFPCVGH